MVNIHMFVYVMCFLASGSYLFIYIHFLGDDIYDYRANVQQIQMNSNKSEIIHSKKIGDDLRRVKFVAPKNCPPHMRFIEDKFLKHYPKTALVSYPGSGNTWVRHLIELATGFHTGSNWFDIDLYSNGFFGEGINNKSVVVIKTHNYTPNHIKRYKRAIILIRTPLEAAIAEWRRNIGNHTFVGSMDIFDENWQKESDNMVRWWCQLHMAWLTEFKGEFYFLHYSKLKKNLRFEMRTLLDFMQWEVTESQLDCVEQHSEGLFHRKTKTPLPSSLFKPESIRLANRCIALVQLRVADRTAWQNLLTGLSVQTNHDPSWYHLSDDSPEL